MPTPKLKSEVVAQYDRVRRHEHTALVGALNQVLPGSYHSTEAALRWRRAALRQVEDVAWQLSCPEGIPPYPRRGETYSQAEALWLADWLSRSWAVVQQLRAEEQLTYDFLAQHVSPTAWYEQISYILDGASTRQLEGGLRQIMSGADVYGTSTIYMGSDHTPNSQTFTAAGKTPKEWAAVVWRYALRNVAPVAENLRTLRSPILYQKQVGDDAIDAQLNLWESISSSCAWRAANRFYGVHENHDKLPDLRKVGGRASDSIRYLRYSGETFGPAVPWSEIIHRVREKEQGRAAEAQARSRATEARARHALQALAAAKLTPDAWNASQVKKYLPPEFVVDTPNRLSYSKAWEIVVSEKGSGYTVFRVSAPVGASRADAYLVLGNLIELFRRSPKTPCAA